MPVPEHLGQVLTPLGYIFPDNRLMGFNRIVQNDDFLSFVNCANRVRREPCCSEINLAQGCMLLCQKRKSQDLNKAEKQYKSSFCHDAELISPLKNPYFYNEFKNDWEYWKGNLI